MRFLSYIFSFLFISIYTIETTGYKLVLNDEKSTLDGTTLSSTEINGVAYNEGIINISLEGTYILSGTLNVQIKKFNRNSNFGIKWCNNKEFSFKCNFI